MVTWRVRWLRRGNGTVGRQVLAAGMLVPLTATGAAHIAASPGTLELSPARATAGNSADVFVFRYTDPSKPIPGTVSITVPAGFSVPQDTGAGTAGYLSTSSSCASFQVSGITTTNGAATVTLAVNCAAKGTGSLIYEDVTVPTTAGAYPFATSFTRSGSQTPIAFTAQHSVTVKPGPLASLTLSPADATIVSGGSQAYTAQGFDAYGNSLGNITSTTKFKISPDGRCTATACTATATGTHIVIGTSKKITSTATLNVTARAASHLYWTDGGAVYKANLDGTNPQSMVTGLGSAFGVAVDGSHIYWANYLGTVNEANLDGTSPQTIITGQNGPYGVAVDGSHIYWTDENAGTVNEANLDGTSPQTIVTGQDPFGVAVDGSHIYWANGGTVNEANLNGTSPRTIITGLGSAYGVAVDGSHIYWTSWAGDTINEANLNGTSPRAIITGQSTLAGVVSAPAGMAVDGSHIYWANTGNGTISDANLDGTSPQIIIHDTSSTFGVTVGP
jgi:Domain of unknown function (DUF5050)